MEAPRRPVIICESKLILLNHKIREFVLGDDLVA
jgi:hypothetical protein